MRRACPSQSEPRMWYGGGYHLFVDKPMSWKVHGKHAWMMVIILGTMGLRLGLARSGFQHFVIQAFMWS